MEKMGKFNMALGTVCLFLLAFHRLCEGFDLTFNTIAVGNGTPCGVLRCLENVQSVLSNHHRTIASLMIYKQISPSGGGHSSQWEQLAKLTRKSPNITKNTDGINIRGSLTDTEASFTLEVSRPGDCLSIGFSCAAILVNSDTGRSTEMRGVVTVGPSAGSGSDQSPRSGELKDMHLLDGSSMAWSDGHITKDEQVIFSMWEKLKYIEKQLGEYHRDQDRLEDKIEELKDTVKDEISDKLQESEIRMRDQLDRLENRLEDTISASSIGVVSKHPTSDICSRISAQFSAVAMSVVPIKNNLTHIVSQLNKAEAAASLTASTATRLDKKLTNITSRISSVLSLTDNLGNDFHAFSQAYMSGALLPVEEFFDALGTGRKEWRLAFRGTAYNNVQVYPAYMYGTGIPPEVEVGCKQFNRNLSCINHYRNRDAIENWDNIDEVLFAVYLDGHMVKNVVFNARGSSYTNWFEANRVVVSSWTDLKTQTHNFFSIIGEVDPQFIRRFYMSHIYHGCPNDEGWFMVTEMSDLVCSWGKSEAFPLFLYAPGSTKSRWSSPTFGRADAVGIFLKYY